MKSDEATTKSKIKQTDKTNIDRKSLKKSYILHPFLFAIFPVLFLYSHNIDEVNVSEIFFPAGFMILATFVLVFLLFIIFRKHKPKALVLISTLILFIFTFGYIVDIFDLLFGSIIIRLTTFIGWALSIWSILILFTLYKIIRSKKDFIKINKAFNAISIVLVAMSVFSIVSFNMQEKGSSEVTNVDLSAFKAVDTTENTKKSDSMPDIYYIIMDRYANNQTYLDFHGFDNSYFTDFLHDKNFYVADKSFSNYLRTGPSLASSMNLEYIENEMLEKYGSESRNWKPLYNKVINNKILLFLKSQGYKYHHLGSAWQPTEHNPHADENVNVFVLPEFQYYIYKRTFIYHLFAKTKVHDARKLQYDRISNQFKRMNELAVEGRVSKDKPKFVFAHFLLPHTPFVFTADGKFLGYTKARATSRKEKFIGQTKYANDELMKFVENIFKSYKTGPKPIVIIQSDEGPFPQKSMRNRDAYDWHTASDEFLQTKFRILNALYIPEADEDLFAEEMTPVNTFRIVLNTYFGTDLKILPNKCFAHKDEYHPYSFFEVTDKVKFK